MKLCRTKDNYINTAIFTGFFEKRGKSPATWQMPISSFTKGNFFLFCFSIFFIFFFLFISFLTMLCCTHIHGRVVHREHMKSCNFRPGRRLHSTVCLPDSMGPPSLQPVANVPLTTVATLRSLELIVHLVLPNH